MFQLGAGRVLGFFVALALGPSGASELQRCLDGCDASASDTDRATCRLQCREKEEAKDSPDVVRWHTEELKGGSPDPNVRGGKTTTTTVVTPRGTETTTKTETTPTAGTSVARQPALDRVSAMYSKCQLMCEGHDAVGPRASCRTRCGVHERRRKIAIVSSHGDAPHAAPRSARQRRRAARPGSQSCRESCVDRANRCRDACTGDGSNQATCELQCDQSMGACERRCPDR